MVTGVGDMGGVQQSVHVYDIQGVGTVPRTRQQGHDLVCTLQGAV